MLKGVSSLLTVAVVMATACGAWAEVVTFENPPYPIASGDHALRDIAGIDGWTGASGNYITDNGPPAPPQPVRPPR